MNKCRLCFTDTDPKLSQNIYHAKVDPPIWKIIKQLSNLSIKKRDPYTKLVCLQCFKQLNQIYAFRQMILDTDHRMRRRNEHLSKNPTNKSDSVDQASLTLKTETIDCIVKEEPIEIDEEPLKIEHETSDNYNVYIKDCGYQTPDSNDNNTKNDHQNLANIDDYSSSDEVDHNTNLPIGNNNKTNQRHLCNICNQTFKHKSSLNRHSAVHLGQEPYQCTLCNRRFTQTGGLQAHLRTHTGEKPFKCHTCQRQFTEKSTLKVHLRTHSGEQPYACDLCHRRFTQNSNLRRHLRTHTNEKLYKCTNCDKEFLYKSSLEEHLRVHTGEQPFQCNYCQKRFKHASNYRRHYKMLHLGIKR